VTAFAFDARRWTLADRVTGGATLILLVSLFLPWFGTDGGFFSVSVDGMWHGYMVIDLILAVAIVGYLVLRAGFGSLPLGLPITTAGHLLAGAAGLNLLLAVTSFATKPAGTNWQYGAYVGLVAAIVAVTAPIVASEDLGKRRSRAHFLDSAAMIALVEGDPGAAWRFIAEAAEAAAGMAEPSLLADIALHRALAGLSAGDIPAAQRDADLAAEQISRGGPGVSAGTLDAMAVTACIALARGDAAGAAAGAAELAEQAGRTGFVLWERAAQRISATASAERAGTGPPDPCRYPALIYVDRPIPANG
jgi:hypothetical protein